MQLRKTPRPFTQDELDYIKENAEKMTMKEIAIELKRSYASIHTKYSEIKSFVPRGSKTKKKYIPPPPKPIIQRPPAQYSNKPTGLNTHISGM